MDRSKVWAHARAFFVVFVVLLAGSLEARSVLNFPFLTFQQDTITGVAIVNLGEEDAQVQVTAYLSDGQLLQGPGIENPVQLEVAAGTQSGTITVSLFGAGPELGEAAWFQAVSEADDLTGFFLYLDTDSSFLDGADLPPLSSRLVVSDVRVGAGKRTELNLINPTGQAAAAQIRLVSNEGAEPRDINLAPRGAARLDVEEFFSQPAGPLGVPADDPVYLLVESNQELAGFAFVQPGSDLLGLNAQPAAETLNGLFFPQMAVLDLFETELMVVSLADQDPVILTITAYRPDGVPFGAGDLQTNPVTRVLEPGAVLREDVQQMFGFAGATTLDGWLRVESTSQAIHGAVSYSIPALGSIASVASAASGTRSAVFSHIATTFNFFTGVAILNGGKLVANVEVVAVQQDGTVLGSFRTTLAPGQRLSRTLTEMIPAAADQAGGFILIRSDVPVYLTNVFGNLVSGVLSNVPPQPAPEEFEVDTQKEPINVSPPLAIVPVAGNQQFSVMGPAGPATWSVNGEPGGGALQGTVDGTGRYTAPAQIPGALPVVVTARIGEDTAGAATDVLSREVVLGDLGVVQSVAYLSGLQRLYTSELSLGAGPGTRVAGSGASSTIFDVTAGAPAQVAEFAGEDIPKMIPYTGSDGKEGLLLAAKTTGRVLYLDPQTQQTATLVTGLNEPVSLVLDPVNGDLLVAEGDGVTRVAAAVLAQGLAGASAPAGLRLPGGVIEGGSPAGVAVDRCTGEVYVSDSAQGGVRRVHRLSGEASTLVDGLSNPGQLLGLYRSGISCPDSFHLLIAERGADRVLLWTAAGGLQNWVASPGIRDLALKVASEGEAPASLLPNQPGVLLGETSEQIGQVTLVPADLYDEQAINPVAGNQLVTGIVEYSPNVRLLSSPPPAVGDEDLTDADEVHVFLEKVVTLTQDLTPDLGQLIPAGSSIRSYFFHYDPPGTSGQGLDPGFVRFDDRILGVINQAATLNDTDGLLGSIGTDYSGTVSRAWADSDGVQVSEDGGRIDFNALADAGQDQMRVLLPVELAESPGPDLPGSYEVTLIGPVNSLGQFFERIDMNNQGDIVFWGPGPFFADGFIWLSEARYGLEAGLNAFPTPPGEEVFLPSALNDSGQVVGFSGSGAWLWQNGSFQSLDSVFVSSPDASPYDINNQGQMAGWTDELVGEDLVTQAFLFDGSFSLLGSPFGPTFVNAAFAINNSGQVIGGAQVPLQQPAGEALQFVAILWPSGPGSGQVIAENALSLDINDSGQVVYTVFGPSGGQGILWDNGSTIDLGTLGGNGTQAIRLNNLGQVVGASQTADEVAHAFLWSDGQMIDLNERIGSSEIVLIRAVDITDSGMILCLSGSTLYLLTPQPEQ